MYTEFFGLDEDPFSIAPNPRYIYLGEQHRRALAHLEYGAEQSNGFVVLTGEIGSGKTTLIRYLLANIPAGVEVAYLFNPDMSPVALLRGILSELVGELSDDERNKDALLQKIYAYLLAAHTRGNRVVVIIDEAQRLSAAVLEEIRLLTNFETDNSKLINVVLVGQPELRQTLMRAELRQLAQRVTARYHLEPLDFSDTQAYVAHRLKRAGAPGQLFSRLALRRIYKTSHGIPRLINQICGRSLMGAYARSLRQVSASLAKEAIYDLAGHSVEHRERFSLPWWMMFLLLAMVLGTAVMWWFNKADAKSPPRNSGLVSQICLGDILASKFDGNTRSLSCFVKMPSSLFIPLSKAQSLEISHKAHVKRSIRIDQ